MFTAPPLAHMKYYSLSLRKSKRLSAYCTKHKKPSRKPKGLLKKLKKLKPMPADAKVMQLLPNKKQK